MPLRDPLAALGAELPVIVHDVIVTTPVWILMPPPPLVPVAPLAVFPLIVELVIDPRLINRPPELAAVVFPPKVEFVIVFPTVAAKFAPPPLPAAVLSVTEVLSIVEDVPAKLMPPAVPVPVALFAVMIDSLMLSVPADARTPPPAPVAELFVMVDRLIVRLELLKTPPPFAAELPSITHNEITPVPELTTATAPPLPLDVVPTPFPPVIYIPLIVPVTPAPLIANMRLPVAVSANTAEPGP